MKNNEINQKRKGSTRSCLRGALDVAITTDVRSGGGQELLELGPPLSAVLPLVTLGGQHCGNFCHRCRLDLFRWSGQQFRKSFLESRNDALTHHLTKASDGVVVNSRKQGLDERHDSFDRLLLLVERGVGLASHARPDQCFLELHLLPPVFVLGMCHRASMARLLSRHKHSISSRISQWQQKITISGVSYLLTFWIKKFSSPKMRNREFVFTPKIEYELVAERSEANQNSLTFPTWCG